MELSLEQQARDMLDRAGVEDAQDMSSGALVEIANLIDRYDRAVKDIARANLRINELERAQFVGRE